MNDKMPCSISDGPQTPEDVILNTWPDETDSYDDYPYWNDSDIQTPDD